jgi:hypothetical protein
MVTPVIQHKLYKGFIDPSKLLPLSKTLMEPGRLMALLRGEPVEATKIYP